MRTKAQLNAIKKLGFDPLVMANQVEPWLKATQWHGPAELKKLLVKAGFNLPLLICHLENMVKVLK